MLRKINAAGQHMLTRFVVNESMNHVKLDGENKRGAKPVKADIVLNAHIHTLTRAHRCTSDDFIDVLLYLLSDDPCTLLLHKDSLLLPL